MSDMALTKADVTGSMTSSLNTTQPARQSRYIAWLALVAVLLITAVSSLYIASYAWRIAEGDFISRGDDIHRVIADRLDDYARVLQSCTALFKASDVVTHKEWRCFVQTINVDKQLPGIQGIGWSVLIPRAELTRHIQEIRREGFPQYDIRPAGDRAFYSSIIYLEPFSDRNIRAFGYDMFSEPVRRKAMEQARDTDAAALSGPVVLVQETDKDIQAGTLMYVPVYRKGMPTASVDQRRSAIWGWAYSPYRMTDMIRGMLGQRNLEKALQLHLEVYDGEQPSSESLLYRCHPAEDKNLLSGVRFTRQVPVDFNGHFWTLCFTQTGGGFFTAEYDKAWITMGSGTLVALLLFILIRFLLNTRAQAQQMAKKLIVDLRDRKKAEDSLRTYNEMMKNITEGIFIIGVDDNLIKFTNEKFERMFGYESGEMVGKHVDIVNAPTGKTPAEHRMEIVEPLLKSGQWHGEIKNIKRDGTPFWCSVSVTIYNHPEYGKVMVSVHSDIDERKRVEEALQLSSKELEAKNAELERFTYTISHDLKSPVVTIKTFIGYLEQDMAASDSGKVVEDVKFIKSAADRMAHLLNDLLEMSRVGKVVSSSVHVTMRALVDEAVNTVAGRISDRGVNVKVADTDVALYGDRPRLAEIWQNLIENACKFMGDEKSPGIDIGLEQRDKETVFFVRDNGIGIEPRYHDRIFDLFETLDKHIEGTGIGLAIVKRIVELYQGRIWVESTGAVQGTTFCFTLPGAIKTPKVT